MIELADLERQRDEGLISIARYKAKKAEIESQEE
jgi:hypothetical protein